ncbi:peptide upstream ORF protein [Salix suchowensis]|nr:peptide upstream ORF protein [Salix suchowensis]
MEVARGFSAKNLNEIKHLQNGGIGLNSDAILVLKLPDSRVMRVVSRSFFLAMILLTLPFEGLIKKGDKALIVCSGVGAVVDSSRFLNDNDIDFVSESDLEQESLFPNATFDFALTLRIEDARFVDRVVKVGGILVTQLSSDPSNAFQKLSNYRAVYLRRYDSTIVALRKTSLVSQLVISSAKRRPLQLALDAKKTALLGLEDVLLEPPRKALAKSRMYLKRFKYLPNLLGDSLEDYSRRVFIHAGLQEEKKGAMQWFNENYPTRNQDFEFHSINTSPEGDSKRVAASPADVSNWLMKNVREDEFVVMKADAEVAEEMMKRKTIGLVDELFLECNNQWKNGERKRSKRAYWECVALYGRLRDEGVAVHQWWD